MLEAIIKRLKHDKHGVSNVIVVMLSLILIVVIVANVVLWSYQMNQVDWRKCKRTSLSSTLHLTKRLGRTTLLDMPLEDQQAGCLEIFQI